jgi:ferredoxin
VDTGKALNPFYITEAVFTHDLVVNVPKLKVHRLARYSGAIKNTYGCVVGGSKQIYHKLFNNRPDYQEFWGKPLVDVCEAVNPSLNVMDAIVGLDKDGPAANGTPRPTGVILASRSGPALDVTACGMIGLDPQCVPAVREAIERGLVTPAEISVIGQVPKLAPYVKLPDVKPASGFSKSFGDFTWDQFIMTPKVRRSRCGNCSVCVRSCVPGAMSLDADGKAVIDYGKCIHCYCCEEFCPKKAVSLHGGVTNHVMRGIRIMLGL